MNHQQWHETVAMAEEWEDEFPSRDKMQEMVADWSSRFAIQEREKEAGWQRFAAEMQVNIDKMVALQQEIKNDRI